MLEVLKGKKLLVLAGEVNLISLVERAKKLGIYTVVTDYNDTVDSPAKLVADEYWNISWTNLDVLEQKCREEKIDGITTGYSETRVEYCIELCKRLDLPCYCTKDQLTVTKDKVLFKNECRKNKVPVVREFSSVEDVDSYPVIVKPTDRAGSIGVGIALNKEELVEAYEYAMQKSYSKRVIIEEYISNGIKFDVTYAICGGKIIFLTDCDTIISPKNGVARVVQNGWQFPSRYHDAFMKKVDEPIRNMIKSLGIVDGYITFSGFSIPKNGDIDFVFFETGLRLSGGHSYNYISKLGIINVLDIFIVHALTGNTHLVKLNENSNSKLKCTIINYYAENGTICKIEGIDKIKKLNDCGFFLQVGNVGQKCNSENAILAKVCMIHLFHHSAESLAKDVKYCNLVYRLIDANGNDMIYDRIDPDIVKNWWKV